MSQIRQGDPLLAVLLLLVVFSLAGCGSANDSASFNPNSGSHPAGWLPAGHTTKAVADMESCAQCHGADYKGGISKVSCTECHIGNERSVHPTDWGLYAYATHGGYVKSNGNDTSGCANVNCHGATLTGVSGSGPSCTLCHMGGVDSIHPAAWNGSNVGLHKTRAGYTNYDSCRNIVCHGAALEGAYLSGHSCYLCHKTLP
jgi:hypothetical protein